MDTLIEVYKEGDWFVAMDLVTNVTDQGKTREEAIERLKIGLQEHYEILLEEIEEARDVQLISLEVRARVFSPTVVST